MKTVIIAPTHRIGIALAQKRGINVYDGETVVVTEEMHLRGRRLEYATVLMLSDSWGVRPGGYDRAMRLEQTAKQRGASIEWVTP